MAAYVDPYTAPYRGTEVLQRGPGAEGVWGEARSPEKPETNANFQLRRGTWETGGGACTHCLLATPLNTDVHAVSGAATL